MLETVRTRLFVVLSALALTIPLLGSSAGADASTDLGDAQRLLRQCQLDLKYATTNAERTRAQQCITIKQKVIKGLTTPSPTGSPTPMPSTSSPLPTTPSTTPSPTPTPTSVPTSPTPTSTPTPTSSRQPNCYSRLDECGYPSPATTGWESMPTTVFNGELVISFPGVWENLDVHGCVTIRSPNVTIRQSRVVGNGCGITTYESPGGPITIDHVEVNCVNGHGTGIYGPNVTVVAAQVHDCENGFELNENSTVTDSWITAREATPEGHGDGIQSQGGTNVVVRHNTILAHGTSAIITNPTLNNNWTLIDNFLGGGAFTLYCPEQATGWTVRGNRFVPAKAQNIYGEDSAAFGLTDACNHAGITWTDNYLDPTLAPVNPE